MLLPTIEEMFAASAVIEAADVSAQQKSQPMMVGTMAVGKAVTFGSTKYLKGAF